MKKNNRPKSKPNRAAGKRTRFQDGMIEAARFETEPSYPLRGALLEVWRLAQASIRWKILEEVRKLDGRKS